MFVWEYDIVNRMCKYYYQVRVTGEWSNAKYSINSVILVHWLISQPKAFHKLMKQIFLSMQGPFNEP